MISLPHARRLWRALVVVAFAAACGLPPQAVAQDTTPSSPTSSSTLADGVFAVLLVLALLALSAALTWARAMHQRQRRQAIELQAQASLAELVDVWQWRTDARHRLVQLRPPRGEPADAWRRLIGEPLLWDGFACEADDAQALQAAIHAHAPFEDLPARLGSEQVWLRGRPQLDVDGRFSHYVGVARRAAATRSCGEDLAATPTRCALLQAFDTPAFEVSTTADGWWVQGGNAAAARWLDLPVVSPCAWSAIAGRWPAGWQAATPPAPLDEASTYRLRDDLSVRVHPLPGRRDCAWLVMQPPAAETASPVDTAANEHETFSYTISHDLRAPIRVVEGFTRILKEDYGLQLDRIGNDHLDRVLGASARMTSMIDSLLALSQLSTQPLARQPVDLSQLAGYVIEELRRQSPERQVRVVIEPGLCAHGDVTLLRVALENLIGNAWKYTARRNDACIWFERSEHEGRPAFTVRDNGAGFDMRFADRLFGVFQRLHGATEFQGTGVGLASVRRIIRRHGGDIWAEGEVDKGARFQFWIRN